MNTFTIILGASVTLDVAEVVIFLLAAVLLGFSIHFYWFGRRSVSDITQVLPLEPSGISDDDSWRLQYYEQLEQHEKNEERLEKELLRMSETEKHLLEQLEEARDEISRLERLAEKKVAASESTSSSRHMSELVIAQQNLHEYLSKEMTERLDKAYQEFNFLQSRLEKLQIQVVEAQNRNLEVEELEESFARLNKDHEELKLKNITLLEDNQKLVRTLSDTEEKLRDTVFEKEQLTKKVVFLEDLIRDLKEISAHHKKLESQLKRVTEIEALMTKTSGDIRKT